MSLASYSDLETAVANWLGRAGDTVVTTNVPDWITLCEARIAYGSGDPDDPDISMFTKPLRIRAMETPVDLVIGTPIVGATVGGTANAITLTPTASIASYTNGLLYQFSPIATNTAAATLNVSGVGVTSIVKDCARDALSGNELVIGGTYNVYYDALNAVWVLLPDIAQCPLPASYLAMRSLFYYWGTSFIQTIDYEPPQSMNRQFISSFTGPPRKFTIEQDAMRFAPNPDATYYAPCTYYKKFSPLSGGNNWLMTNAPSVYLFGALLEASVFLDDDRQAQKYLKLYRGACNALQSQDSDDRHSGSALTVSNDTGNP